MGREPFSAGHRLFWTRVLVVVVLAYVLLDMPPAVLPRWVLELGEIAGLILLSLAALGRIWCCIYIAGKKHEELVTQGPYSIVRNPLYLFSFLGAVGFGLAVENPILASFLAIGFGTYYAFVVRREESRLRGFFGTTYQEYAERTPRWIPRFSSFAEPEDITVHPRKIRDGILDAMWFLWAFMLWELVETLRPTIP